MKKNILIRKFCLQDPHHPLPVWQSRIIGQTNTVVGCRGFWHDIHSVSQVRQAKTCRKKCQPEMMNSSTPETLNASFESSSEILTFFGMVQRVGKRSTRGFCPGKCC